MDKQNIESLWGHLHWLTVLAQQGSFTAAAARLGVSKAAMSQRLADLERAAGVPLVQRTTRSVRLTEAGQRLVDDTQSSFEQIAHTFAAIQDEASQPRGLLRITAPVALSRQQLVPALSRFLTQYPDIRIELDMSDRLASLSTEGFDLAIRHTDNPPDTHVAWLLCDTHSVLVASRSYLDDHGEPQSPHELCHHNCLHYPRERATPIWTFEPKGSARTIERLTVPIRGSLAANNSEALRDAAMCGLGIALVPDFSAQASLRAGTLVSVLDHWIPVGSFSGRLYAIRPYSPQVPRAVSLLVSHLRETFNTGFLHEKE